MRNWEPLLSSRSLFIRTPPSHQRSHFRKNVSRLVGPSFATDRNMYHGLPEDDSEQICLVTTDVRTDPVTHLSGNCATNCFPKISSLFLTQLEKRKPLKPNEKGVTLHAKNTTVLGSKISLESLLQGNIKRIG